MASYIFLYYFYRSAFMSVVRIIVCFFLGFWLYGNFKTNASLNLPLFFLSVFLQWEIVFQYKISQFMPEVTIEKNDGKNLYYSCTKELLLEFIKFSKTTQVIAALLRTEQGRFILQKIPAEITVVPMVELTRQDLLNQAYKLAKEKGGLFITTTDLLGAYFLGIESEKKFLFNKQLKQEEFLEIIAWAREVFVEEERPKKHRVQYIGSGIGEGLTTGWTLETKKYTSVFSWKAFSIRPEMTGREKEFETMISTLSKAENNNVLLVGDPGSGRENLVALLATESFSHSRSLTSPHLRVLELMIGPLIAGSANRADLEARLQAVIEEVSHASNIVLYIPELQNITGSSSYDVDLSGALFPYLQSGQMPIIASVTPGNFKTYIEKSSLSEAFTIIKLEEPDTRTVMKMLLQKAAVIEDKQHVFLTYKAIEAAILYANRYFQNAALPGSAVNLLEDVSHTISEKSKGKKVYILADNITEAVEQKTHIAVAQPKGEEKELLLHLEDRLHERVIDQEDAIKAIGEAMRRLRSGLVSLKRPISFLFLGPTGVGKSETAKALAALYFGGEDKMIRLDMSEYADIEGVKRLLGAPPGEGEERGEITDKISEHPFSLVLLDEFEKAHPKILDLFLQVLEDGRLTDNKGKTVNFVNSIIIATSNAGAEFIRESINKSQGTLDSKVFKNTLLDYLQKEHQFRPELLNRFDDVIVFKPLGIPQMQEIAKILLEDMTRRLKEQDITFSYDDTVMQKIVNEGFDPQFGARPLRRYIQSNVEDIIAQKKLKDEIKRGNSVHMSTDVGGTLQADIS